MTDPVVILPAPRSVTWTGTGWRPRDAWREVTQAIDENLPAQDHAISVSAAGAAITAGSEAALHDGRATFGQLLDTTGEVPGVLIQDGPRFPWRGVMIDVARHFLPLPDLRRMIDALALHRLNILHLHLTDDQGWRFEVKGYPRLTEVGAWRDRTLIGHQRDYRADPEQVTFAEERHGGCYTQEELRELVAYASARGVTIVPEVDLPGHVQAAIAAYPELGNLVGTTVRVREVWGISDHVLGTSRHAEQFVRDVVEQLADVFPGPYLHLGADECPRTEWQRSYDAQRFLARHGMREEREIQGWFTALGQAAAEKAGRRLVAWDEVLDAVVPDDTIVMAWQDASRAHSAIDAGYQTVVADQHSFYLDRAQARGEQEPLSIGGTTTLKDVYGADPMPADLTAAQESLVLGVQAQLWTEYMPDAAHLEYMAFPRLCAFAEVAWGGARSESFRSFRRRLARHLPRLDALGIRYRPLS